MFISDWASPYNLVDLFLGGLIYGWILQQIVGEE
jgi:hypothetical protein